MSTMSYRLPKRHMSPSRTRHEKRKFLLAKGDDWRRAPSSIASKDSTDSESTGNDLNYVTEKFSGFLADFLAEYASPRSPQSPASNHDDTESGTRTLTPSESLSRTLSRSFSESPAPSSWRSDSQELTTDSEEETDDASTIADGESIWEDEDLDTPGSPGSDIELNDGVIKRGMYITVVLSNRERSTAVPCTAKVLDVHDRRGKFTLRLSKSARRATRTMWSAPRSPAAARGRYASPIS